MIKLGCDILDKNRQKIFIVVINNKEQKEKNISKVKILILKFYKEQRIVYDNKKKQGRVKNEVMS